MSNTIETDIDRHQINQFSRFEKEFKLGNITLDHIKWFVDLDKNTRDRLAKGYDIPMNSQCMADRFCVHEYNLGTITVPQCGVNMKNFLQRYKEIISEFNIDGGSNLVTVEPGKSFKVMVFSQNVKYTGEDERKKFLSMKEAVTLGFQGLLLVFEQSRHLLTKGCTYSVPNHEKESFEDKRYDDCLGTPEMTVCYGDVFNFKFNIQSGGLEKRDLFLGFFKIENEK